MVPCRAPMPFCMSSISSSMPFFPLLAYLFVGSKCMQRNFTLAATILACKHFPRHGAKPANGIAYVFSVFAQHKYPWDESFLLLDRYFPPNSYSTCSVFIITYNTHTKKTTLHIWRQLFRTYIETTANKAVNFWCFGKHFT